MLGNDNRSVLSWSSGWSDLASSGHWQEDGRLEDKDTTPPPLGVKLTVYRLLNITIIFLFGIIKGILAYMGKSSAPTTLDCVSGALLAAVLYWIGLHGRQDARRWEWFFHVDLAPGIAYFGKCFVGGVMGALFFFYGMVPFNTLNYTLNILAGHLCDPDNFFSRGLTRRGTLVAVLLPLGVFLCLLLLWFCFIVLIRRLRARGWEWQWAIRFMGVYGLEAPMAKQYRWFGVVGKVMGTLCVNALPLLPVVVYYFYLGPRLGDRSPVTGDLPV